MNSDENTAALRRNKYFVNIKFLSLLILTYDLKEL